MSDQPTEIIGLAELQRAMRALDDKLPRELSKANKEAAQFVVDKAQAAARRQGGVAAKSAPALKAAGQQRNSAVRLDGRRYPWALGAEFGSKQFKQFKSWRGNQWSPDRENGVGYFLQPTIRATRAPFEVLYLKLLDDLIDKLPDGGTR